MKKIVAVMFVVIGSVGLIFLEPITSFLYNTLFDMWQALSRGA